MRYPRNPVNKNQKKKNSDGKHCIITYSSKKNYVARIDTLKCIEGMDD